MVTALYLRWKIIECFSVLVQIHAMHFELIIFLIRYINIFGVIETVKGIFAVFFKIIGMEELTLYG